MSQARHEQGTRILRFSELDQAVRAFLVDREARGLAPGTIQFYRKKLRYLQVYLRGRGVRRVEDATPAHLREFLIQLSERLNPGGVHACFRAARTFLRWYEDEIEPENWRNPIHRLSPPKVPQQVLDPLALPDLRKMLSTCRRRSFTGDRDKAVLLALLDTGCRAGEFVSLNVGDVNPETGAVIVRRGKGGKFRTVYVGSKTRKAIMRYLRHRRALSAETPLWVTRDGDRLTYAGLRQIVRRRAKSAGAPVPSLHSFRRAFALACLRAGVDVVSLSRLLGHADTSVLRRYLALVEADLQRAHEKAGVVDKLL